MKHSTFKRLLALLLCFAMLLPNMTGLVYALETDNGSAKPSEQQTEPKEEPWVPVVPQDIPAYDTVGKKSEELICDDGNGLSQDGAKSYFRMVTGTNVTEFNAYLTKLTGAGFEKRAESRLDSNTVGEQNTYTRWLSPEGNYVLSVYYTPDYNEVKIVADTGEDAVKSFTDGFVYESTTGETAEVMMTMYGLSMSSNGYDITTTKTEYNLNRRNCGTLVVIRMPDNSLFVNDGGDIEQWSDEACADFLAFCREITGKKEGEKVVFNTWFISHAHSDHFLGLPRFIDMYHNDIDIKNVMYSLDDEMLGSTRDMGDVMKMVKAYYPDVKYYKPHTGEQFSICGIEFDVLYTQEDRFLLDANGGLDKGKVASKTRNNGTYRDFLRDLEAEEKEREKAEENGETFGDYLYDYNDTSTVLKLTFPQNVTGADRDYTSILYADVNLGDQVILDTIAPSLLTTDVMMVPHHGHDAHPELVAMSGADIFLYTQHKQAIYGPDNDWTTVDAAGTYRPNLRNLFLEMHEQDANGDEMPDLYFDTTAARKTYWGGNETAVIVFGESKTFAEAEALGMKKDQEDPTGYSVWTKAAPDFEYGGWTVLSTVVGTNSITTSKITTNSVTICGVGVELASNKDGADNTLLEVGGKYIIVHDQTDQIMRYQALNGTEDPARPGSYHAGTRDEVDAGLKDAYFTNSDGISKDNNIYFIQHMRDAILWEFGTTNWSTGETIKVNQGSPAFGGDAEGFYYRSVWFKGLSSEEPYWTVDPADAGTAWRWFQVSNAKLARKTTATSASYNYRVEFFANNGKTDVDGDGTIEACDTCVIYYSNGDGEYSFLTVDEQGNWIQKKYNSASEVTASELAKLKLRLYRYDETSTPNTVGATGNHTYYTTVCSSKDEKVQREATQELIDAISYQLTVRDTYRRNLEIPCTGTTPMVGYYWLDGDLDLSAAKHSAIQVKYRNDDGTDTLITTLDIYVAEQIVAGADLVNEGMAAIDTALGGSVYETRHDSGEATDCIMSLVMATENGYVRQEMPVSVTLGMLSYNANSRVDGEPVSGSVGGIVDTNVEAGTVYTNLTLSWQGMPVTENFTLRIEDVEQVDDPAYPEKGSLIVNKTGTAAGSSFFKTGIADIQLSATGVPMTDGVDVIIVLDMSGSMNLAASEQDTTSRLVILKDAMKDLMKTLGESDVDFRVSISDFGDLDHYVLEDAVVDKSIRGESFFDTTGGTDWNDAGKLYGSTAEFYNHLNYVFSKYQESGWYDSAGQMITDEEYNALSAEEKAKYTYLEFDERAQPWNDTITKWNKAHNQYVGSAEPNVYTGSMKVDADAFVRVTDKTEAEWSDLIDGFKQGDGYWYGTNYDRGLEYMYRLGYAIQQDNIEKGLDREVVAVFMSDGAPMQYNYFSGRTITSSWPDWFTGEIEVDKFQTAIFDENNRPEKLVEMENLILKLIQSDKNEVPNVDALFVRSNQAEARLIASGIIDETTGKAKYKDNSVVLGWNSTFTAEYSANEMCNGIEAYFKLEALHEVYDAQGNLVMGESGSLYNAFYRNGIYLDAMGYERIAKVNGHTIDIDTCTEAEFETVDAALLALAKEGKLRYPTIPNSSRYIYDETATNLWETLEIWMGREVGYLELVQIAWRINGGEPIEIDGVTYDFRAMLQEIYAEATTLKDGYEWGTLSPYSYFYNEEGKNWWAEAVKGDTDKLYPVVNKYAYDDSTGYFGTIRNHYDSGTGAAYDGKDYIGGFRGLGIPIYTLGLSVGATEKITNEDTIKVLKNISSGETYAYTAYSADDLNMVFSAITSSAVPAATRGWYVDTLGDAYDLLTTTVNGKVPVIEVRDYVLDKNHNRTGKYQVLESITFNVTNEKQEVLRASSSQIFTTEQIGDDEVFRQIRQEIWLDNGLIKGRYVTYNTNTKGTNRDVDGDGVDDIVDGSVKVDLNGDNKPEYWLAPESFFWTVGTIGATEMVLDYSVYLSGSYDNNAPKPAAGDYPTNKSAVLNYVNYLGNDMTKPTVSPEFPWGKARVGYGFYLVDQNGNPIVDQLTGETGSIQNAVKLTAPVYQNVTWGTALTENKISSEAVSGVLDEDYFLYAGNVDYMVSAYADGTGSWDFRSDTTGTTYVQYGGTYTNVTSSSLSDGQTHDTVVWFAVKQISPMTLDKTVKETEDHFTLTLEAFANAEISQMSTIKPADIVLVLDQSASMFTPAGAPNTLDKSEVYGNKDQTDKGQVAYADLSLAKGAKLGYYIAQSQATKTWFVAEYKTDLDCWYFYDLSRTDVPIKSEPLLIRTHADLNDPNKDVYNLVFYKTQYAMLYDSVLAFIQNLRQSGVAHNVSIVGFAGSETQGSCLYVGGDETATKSYYALHEHPNTNDARRKELYQKAMKNVAVDVEYEELLALVESIYTNYDYTCPAVGLKMANESFRWNEVNSQERDRILVLFTDGLPNVKIGQAQGDSNTTATEIFDEILAQSKTAKNYGAKVYAISTSTTGSGDEDRKFLHYLSSDYPDAESYTNIGAEIEEPVYTMEVSSAGSLNDAFSNITQQFTSSMVSLDETTLLVEVLSKYFDFLHANEGDVETDVRVYTQAYLGNGEWADRVSADDTVKIVLGSTAAGDRLDKVSVSGFDYAEEYVSDTPRPGTNYRGSKLVVEVDIKTRPGFWGGEDVPTNDITTGLYPAGSDIPAKIFPVPDTDIPVDVQIDVDALDKVIYYGSAPLEPSDLLKVTAGGVDVLVTPEGFKPVEDWMDDYISIDWTPKTGTDEDGNEITVTDADRFEQNFSNTEEKNYDFSVTLTNKQSGEKQEASATSNVKILIPVYTFNDTTVPMGYTPDPDSENLVSGPIWVEKNTLQVLPASDPGTEPALTLNYDVSGQVLEDTPVQVQVACTNPDGTAVNIMGTVIFQWIDCADSKNHDDEETVQAHVGSAPSREFTIHVATVEDDLIVIDFGLSVDVHPLSNDTSVVTQIVGLSSEEPKTLNAPFSTSAAGSFGTLQMNDEDHPSISSYAVRYTLDREVGMQMSRPDVFYYVVAYSVGSKTVYDYGKLTIVPATTIYYEDTFVNFSVVENDPLNGVTERETAGGWTDVYTNADEQDFSHIIQTEHRPGEGLDAVDPDSVYGYDSAYTTMAKYSLGGAKMVNVFSRKDAAGNVTSKTGRAAFTFSGTGFDIVSLTSSTSGTIMIRVYQVDSKGNVSPTVYKTYVVDTYYGYAYGDSDDDGDEEWYVDPTATDTLYQVPVMKVEDLPYGTYHAVISASYNSFFAHNQYDDSSYDFYLDAIRIYDPAKDDETSNNAYVQDGEGWPSYQELRDLLISANDFDSLGNTVQSGIVFIDGKGDINSVSDYLNYGPNNELYLMPGQSVAFELNADIDRTNMAAIHLGVKSVGGTAKAEIYAVGQQKTLKLDVATATDLYYDITSLNGYTVVIRNTGAERDAILSLTNIKTTFKEEPMETKERSVLTLRRASVAAALASMESEQLPVLTPEMPALILKDEVMYNVYFSIDNPADLELVEMGLLTWYAEPDSVSVDTAEYVCSSAIFNSAAGWYEACSQGVPAKRMADTMYLSLYAKLADGRYVYSKVVSYSAKTYAYNQLAKESASEQTKTLCVALLNYGAAAQTYFSYNTEALMNADLTAEQRAMVSGYTEGMLKERLSVESGKVGDFGANGGFRSKIPAVSFEGAFSIEYCFKPSYAVDGEMRLYCWSEETYLSAEELTVDNADRVLTMVPNASGVYTGSYTDIAAKDADDTVFVCGVYESDGVRYSTGILSYSFACYCVNGIRTQTGAARALAEAAAVYCGTAKCFFGEE